MRGTQEGCVPARAGAPGEGLTPSPCTNSPGEVAWPAGKQQAPKRRQVQIPPGTWDLTGPHSRVLLSVTPASPRTEPQELARPRTTTHRVSILSARPGPGDGAWDPQTQLLVGWHLPRPQQCRPGSTNCGNQGDRGRGAGASGGALNCHYRVSGCQQGMVRCGVSTPREGQCE